jgi:O-antigen/teichoic acid export membrane protein
MPDGDKHTGLMSRLAHVSTNPFVRSVFLLLGSASLGQAIQLGALLISSRLYTPADFSVLAVFNGVVTIVAVAACLRYEIAIGLPERRADGAALLQLSLLCALVVSAVVGLVIWLVPDALVAKMFDARVISHLWLVPLGIFLVASVSALQQWFIRERGFLAIAHSRIAQGTGHAAVQVGLGLQGAGPIGLIIAQLFNFSLAVTMLGTRAFLDAAEPIKAATTARMRALAATYRQFPIYSTSEALFNAAGLFVPVILIGALAPASEAGHLLLAMYAMQVTLSLVGTAISQVYFSRAPGEHLAGNLANFTQTVLANLMKVGPGPLLFIGLSAPTLFPLVFGSAWERSGILVAWMTPWFIMQFLASPISLAFSVTGHQKQASILQALGFVMRTAAVLVAWWWSGAWITEAYAVSGFVFYALYLALLVATTRISRGGFRADALQALPILVVWAAASVVVVAVVKMLPPLRSLF